jgi:two-component system, chemotaxis family, chemotaxis protein CheY
MASAGLSTKTVVVADDTAFVRDRFRTALEHAGHRVVVIKSASELLALVRTDHAVLDLLVLDLRLPQSGGVDMIRAIRAIDNGRLAVLIFSGTIASADEVRALAALGVAGYVNEYSAVQHILPALAPHLFPDNFNRRSGPRVILGIPIQYRFASTIAAALTLNLSRGGVAIRTTSPLETGAALHMRFRVPGGAAEIEAEGHVVWADRRVGMGIMFDSVSPAHQATIDGFVEAHFFSNRKA